MTKPELHFKKLIAQLSEYYGPVTPEQEQEYFQEFINNYTPGFASCMSFSFFKLYVVENPIKHFKAA